MDSNFFSSLFTLVTAIFLFLDLGTKPILFSEHPDYLYVIFSFLLVVATVRLVLQLLRLKFNWKISFGIFKVAQEYSEVKSVEVNKF